MKVKVLNILTGGLRREGITSTQLDYMKNMDRSDIQIDIAAVYNNESDVIKEFESIGCKVVVFPDRRASILKYMLSLYRTIRKEKYDIVHVHGSSSLMSIELVIAMLAGVKVRIAHSRNTKCDNAKVDKILRPIFNHSYTIAFACGQDAGRWMFGNKTFTVIHNGKDLDKFRFDRTKREAIRKQFGIESKFAIGFVGNINYVKNLSFLVDVFYKVYSINPKSVLFIMGEGPDREKIEKKVKDLGLVESVIFTGRIANVAEMLQGMDLMLLPSLFEGLPNVVLEWQIAGLPSIISDNITRECKVTELVEYLPIDQGTDLWVKKINSLDFSEDRELLSENACQRMKNAKFDIIENAKYLKNIYINSVRKTGR